MSNKQPVYYLQTDSRWKNTDYSAPGEKTTIGKAGCGPTSASMLIETLTGKTYTPVNACSWSLIHGYKAVGQGTYYSYFVPQFKEFGIKCERVNLNNLYGNSKSTVHDDVKKLLQDGYYIIACMGPGVWTSGGHFIVVWDWDDKVRINDSASTKTERQNGDPEKFKSQVKYYWAIDARDYNGKGEEVVTYDEWKAFMDRYQKEQGAKPATLTTHVNEAIAMGLTDGSRPQALASREEVMTMVKNGVKSVK